MPKLRSYQGSAVGHKQKSKEKGIPLSFLSKGYLWPEKMSMKMGDNCICMCVNFVSKDKSNPHSDKDCLL